MERHNPHDWLTGNLTSRAFGADEVRLDPLETGYEGVEIDQDKVRGNGQDDYGGLKPKAR